LLATFTYYITYYIIVKGLSKKIFKTQKPLIHKALDHFITASSSHNKKNIPLKRSSFLLKIGIEIS